MVAKLEFVPTRRGVLALGAGALAATTLSRPATAAKVQTKARIVIIGAGAAGTSLANRLVERLEGASITLLKADDELLELWDAPVHTPGLRWGV